MHNNLRNVGVLHYNPKDPVSGAAGVPRNMTTIAQVMSRAGCSTHFVGKWDAGMATPRHTPRGRGYDSSLFYFQHANDEWAKSMGSGITGIATTGALAIYLNGPRRRRRARRRSATGHRATYAGGVRDPAALSDACADSPDPMPPCFEDVLFKERSLRIVGAHDAAAARSSSSTRRASCTRRSRCRSTGSAASTRSRRPPPLTTPAAARTRRWF